MDTFLTIASRREERDYAATDLPDDAIERILIAGRAAGSAKNTQPCRFTVVRRGSELIPSLAQIVTRPTNVTGAAVLVVVSVIPARKSMFDAGRACQNMMLAAWSEGIGSCPNTIKEPEVLEDLLDLPEQEDPLVILTFGHPLKPRNPHSRPAEAWADALDRLPPRELIRQR